MDAETWDFGSDTTVNFDDFKGYLKIDQLKLSLGWSLFLPGTQAPTHPTTHPPVD